ncbi:MAPEG family protein [Sphingomonas flavalba]|uniref:MAPEG family protein n=1 Tax=Sphingomonas flavalba TaxID=2559804 RepID=UPI0039E042ED
MPAEILKPVAVLIAWSLVMWGWMYATRIPAMKKARVRLDPTLPPGTLTSTLPPEVRWKADNYNHLMEQPTIFYAVALLLAVAGAGDGHVAHIAWAYVVLRIAHSIVQAVWNRIMVRFAIFTVSTLCLIVLAIRALVVVF